MGWGSIQEAFLVCLVLSTVQAQEKAGLHITDCKWSMSQAENSLTWQFCLRPKRIIMPENFSSVLLCYPYYHQRGEKVTSSRETLVCISPKLLHKRVVLRCSTSLSIWHCISVWVSHFWVLQLQVCGDWEGGGWVWAFQWSQLVWDCYLSQKDNQLFWIASWDRMCW